MLRRVLSIVCIALAASAAQAQSKIRVIVIDGQNNHNWRATTPLIKSALESSGRFTVDVASLLGPKDEGQKSPTANVAFPPDLSKYDVVLSNFNASTPWPDDFKNPLETKLKNGDIALVIVHAANNAFTGKWAEFDKMIGMGWRGASYGDRLIVDENGKETRVEKGKGPGAGHGPQHPFTVIVRDQNHPITKGMPAEWMHATDELYQGMRGPVENVRLLATAYASKDKKGSGDHEPMIWTVTYGKGRVFHTPMGHAETAMKCIGFIGTLQRGTEWAATGAVTLPLPANFPTAKEVRTTDSK